MPPRILILRPRPSLHKSLELGIRRLGEQDLQGYVFVATASVRALRALSWHPQSCTGVGSFGHRHAYPAVGSGNIDLRAENGLAQCDRQLELDIVAVAGEEGMWAHRNGEECGSGGGPA